MKIENFDPTMIGALQKQQRQHRDNPVVFELFNGVIAAMRGLKDVPPDQRHYVMTFMRVNLGLLAEHGVGA